MYIFFSVIFLWLFFFCFFFIPVCLSLFYYYSFDACFLRRDRKAVDPDEREGEIVIRIYYMKKYFNQRNVVKKIEIFSRYNVVFILLHWYSFIIPETHF